MNYIYARFDCADSELELFASNHGDLLDTNCKELEDSEGLKQGFKALMQKEAKQRVLKMALARFANKAELIEAITRL